jgi:hypothetical protein
MIDWGRLMKITVSVALTRRFTQNSSEELRTSQVRRHSGALQVYSPEASNKGLKGCIVGSSGMNDGNGMTMRRNLSRRCGDPK